jgi:UDP:flavonoid glycosyltransferase YjiC (YdhE family)
LLDPYDTQRAGPVDGPLLDRLPEPRRGDAQFVFVYLSSGYQPHPSVFDALRPLATALRIHAPRLSSGQLAELKTLGARIDSIAPPLHDVLPQARLVIHNGGSGVASEALLAGVPQVVLSAQIEQDLNGAALQRAGVAKLVRTHEPGISLSSELFRDAMADPVLLQEAADMAVYCRDFVKAADAPSRGEDICLRLLQAG